MKYKNKKIKKKNKNKCQKSIRLNKMIVKVEISPSNLKKS